VQPFPVTDEWIKNFESRFDQYLKSATQNHDVFVSTQPAAELQAIETSQKVLLRKVKYIHSLQNLFFVLAGEELSIQKARETV
jgi:hypothetical protein